MYCMYTGENRLMIAKECRNGTLMRMSEQFFELGSVLKKQAEPLHLFFS